MSRIVIPTPLVVLTLTAPLVGLPTPAPGQETPGVQEPIPVADQDPVAPEADEVQDPTVVGSEPQPEQPDADERRITIAIEEAVQMALGNSVLLEQSRVDTEIAEFDSIGSWGAFEWVFDARATASREEAEGTNNFDGGQGTEIRRDRLDVDLGFSRPVTTGGRFDISFNRILSETNNPIFAERDPDNPGEFLPFDTIDFTDDTLSLSYVQPFLRGAWSDAVTAAQQEAELAQEQQREIERQTRQNLVFDVETRYWDLVAAKLLLTVAEQSLDLGERQLERERTKLDAGVGTEVEVIQAQAEVATRRETLIERQTNLGHAGDDLRVLLFTPEDLLDPSIWLLPIETVTPLPDEALVEVFDISDAVRLLEMALENRTQLRQQDYAIQIARIRHQRSLSDRKSLLDLTLAASSGGFDVNDARARDDAIGFKFPTYSATLNYSIPLGNKTAGYAERAARARIRLAQLEYSNIQTTVASDVRRSLRDLAYRAEAVSAARQSLIFAQRQLQAEEAKYEEGLSTLFQVFEFQQTLTESESSLSTARVEYAKSRVSVINALGLTGEAQP